MPPISYLISAATAALILIIVIERLRRGQLRERHALWWLLLGLAGLVVTLFPGLLDRVADALGVGIPINLAFFGAIAVLFLVNMQHAKELTRLEERTRALAEQNALLDERVRELESRTATDTEGDVS